MTTRNGTVIVTPDRLVELLKEPTLSGNVDEDMAIIWDVRSESLTDAECEVFCSLLTLEGPEVCADHRARWAELAEQARATMSVDFRNSNGRES